MKLFTSSRALLGSGGRSSRAAAFKWLVAKLQHTLLAVAGQEGQWAESTDERRRPLSTKHFCRDSEVRASGFSNADFSTGCIMK